MQSSTCAICISLLDKNDDIFSTICGHVFHMPCLTQWLERSKNCPQCREKLTNSKIFRLYFNFNNNDSIREDSASLQHRVDNMQFQLDLKDKTIVESQRKYQDMEKQRNLLRKEVLKLESELTKKDSAIFALKEQAKYLKTVVTDSETYKAKFESLQTKINEYQAVQRLIYASRNEAEEVAANTNDRQQLVVYVAALKRQLDIECQRRRELRDTVKILNAEKKQWDGEKADLQSKLRSQREMEELIENMEEEIRQLSGKIEGGSQSREGENGGETKASTEETSPLSTIQRRTLGNLIKLPPKALENDDENSPLVTSGRYKLTNLKDDAIKLRSQHLPKNSILTKKPRLADDPTARTTAVDDRYVSDGLGGYMKVEEFPVTNKNRKITLPTKKSCKRKLDDGKNRKMNGFVDLT